LRKSIFILIEKEIKMNTDIVTYFYTKENTKSQELTDESGRNVLVNQEYLIFNSSFDKKNIKNFLFISDYHKNEFDLFMNTAAPISNSHFFIGSLEDGLNAFESGDLFKYPYTWKNDFEFGDDQNFFLTLNDDTKEYISVLFECLVEMLEAGYHVDENRKKIPDWIISWETKAQSKFLEFFKFRSSYANSQPENSFGTSVFTWKEIFLTNKKFRKTLCEKLIIIFENIIFKYKMFPFPSSQKNKDEYDMTPDFWVKNKKVMFDKLKH
jgi:hypothetical protein